MIASLFDELKHAVLEFIGTGTGEFEELAVAIHAFQFANNGPYRSFCDLRKVGEKLGDWTEIPAVPQQAFKVSRLATFPPAEDVREFRTSGTTGEGYGSHCFCDLSLYHAAIEAGWEELKFPTLSRLALTPPPEEAPHSSLSQMMGRLTGRFYLREGRLLEEELRVDLTAASGPVILLGTALAFFNLMEKSLTSLPLPTGSRLMETGGYKGSGRTLSKEAFYAQLTEFFQIESDAIVNEYGMTELSSQFYTHGLGRVHRSGRWLRARVVDPLLGREVEMGQTGMLRLYDLANVGSVLAIQTEDLAVRERDGFLLLGRDPAAVARGCSRSADDSLNR